MLVLKKMLHSFFKSEYLFSIIRFFFSSIKEFQLFGGALCRSLGMLPSCSLGVNIISLWFNTINIDKMMPNWINILQLSLCNSSPLKREFMDNNTLAPCQTLWLLHNERNKQIYYENYKMFPYYMTGRTSTLVSNVFPYAHRTV